MKKDNNNHRNKTVYKVFFAWQDKAEERWLEEMAAQGWLLENYSFLRYDFTAIEPAEYVYRLDYKTTTDKDMEEYKEIFTQSGWEHICSFMGWQYLRIPKDRFIVDIYTDKGSQIEKLRKMSAYAMAVMMPIFIMLVVLDFPTRIEAAFDRYHLSFLNFIFPIIFVLMVFALIMNGIWLLKLSKRIKELEEQE